MKKNLIEDIKTNPARFYRVPNDVIRDRRFRDAERLEILEAWQCEASDETPDAAPSILQLVMDAKTELKRRHDGAYQ